MSAASPYTISPDQEHPLETAGGKARALWQLREAGFAIPAWFVVTPTAFSEGALKDAARSEIETSLDALGLRGKPLAARSSAIEEDAAGASFAGQFESFLGIASSDLEQAILAVANSGYAERVQAYKAARGAAAEPTLPAVIVQELVEADAAGVAFSVDPASGRSDHARVSAVAGLGSTLVDGVSDSDDFLVDPRGAIVERRIAQKDTARFAGPPPAFGVKEGSLDETRANSACISDATAARIAELARLCERRFGRPQDIEWAVRGEELFLLQSRPITTLESLADPSGKLLVWDNSNIAESYGGVTLPLTFSFARYVYTEVYRQFCLVLKVPLRRVELNRAVFGQMLGLIRGRVYYNLISWYKTLALLPGYSLNKAFMEQMMGVKEPLPADAQKEVGKIEGVGKLADGLGLARSLAGLIWKRIVIERDIRRFNARFESALGRLPGPIETLRPEELADHFHELERDLLAHWDAPLVNDFLAMIYFGALRGCCKKWLEPNGESLANELLSDIGGIVSAEPAKRIRSMATLAAESPSAVRALRSGSEREIREALASHPRLKEALESYLTKFGDRCLDELKLESHALADDPATLYRAVGELAATPPRPEQTSAPSRQDVAEATARERLGGSPFRRVLFGWILRQARKRVAARENLRFERTRLFGRVRRVFLEIGKRLCARNVIDDPRDIFYLEIYEIIGFVEGSGTTTRLRELVALRKSEYAAYAEEVAPDDRFQTRGAVPLGNRFANPAPLAPIESIATLRGIGCCAGRARGIAAVVRDPRAARLEPGQILVATQTDPGWIMLFPLAAGLLVERGSLLSHSAIVSRELGLPAIVSVPRLMDTIQSGDELEMDGSTGEILILNRARKERAE